MAPLMRVLRAATIVLASACGADKLPPLSLIQSFNVTPSGGTVSLAGGAVAFNFPANAVSQSVEITATATTGPSSPTVVAGTVYSFQPSLTFNVLVPVTVKYQGATLPTGVRPNELGLYKVVGNVWQRDSLSAVDTAAKTVSASLTGFSIHGILGAPVASVSVTPPTPTIYVTDTLALSAVPKDASSNALPSRAVSWGSSNTAVASVSGAGLVTGVAVGTDTITATSEGVNGTAVVTVSLVPVASVTVSPAVDTIAVLATVQLSATPKDSAGHALSGRVVTWASSDTTKAKVSATGLVTGVAAGTITVTATSGGKTGNAAITVTGAQPLPVASVAVSPAADTIAALATVQLTATLKDSLGNTLTGRVVTWSSSDSTKATVSSTGLVTGVAAGTCTVTATSGSKSGNAAITVTAASGATPVFQDNFISGARAADQNGYGWSAPGSRVSVSSDRGYGGSGYSLKFVYGPDTVGEFGPSSGVGGVGVFTRTDGGKWGANDWLNGSLAANPFAWFRKADGSFVFPSNSSVIYVTSNDSTHLYFAANPQPSNDATGATSVSGTSPYGDQGSTEQPFHLGSTLQEAWVEYEFWVPTNFTARLDNNYFVGGANNKYFLIFSPSYAGGNALLFDVEAYPNYTTSGTVIGSTNTTSQKIDASTPLGGGGDNLIPSPNVNLIGAPNAFIGSGGYVVPGQWTQMRFHCKASSVVGGVVQSDGVFEMWAGGTLIYQKTGGTFGPWNASGTDANLMTNGYLMGPHNSGYTAETDFYIGGFKIYATNPGW